MAVIPPQVCSNLRVHSVSLGEGNALPDHDEHHYHRCFAVVAGTLPDQAKDFLLLAASSQNLQNQNTFIFAKTTSLTHEDVQLLPNNCQQ